MSSSLPRRLAVAGIGIPAALGVVYLGGWVLTGLVAVLGVLGATELFRMARVHEVRALDLPGQAAAALVPVGVFASLPQGGGLAAPWVLLAAAAWVILVLLLALRARGPNDRPLSAVSVTVFAPVYAAALPAFLLWLRYPSQALSPWAATSLVFLPLVVTWLCDTAAMMGGSAFGGPKLAPVLSPKKTWSGAVSGAVGAVVVALVYGRFVLGAVDVRVPAAALVLVGLAVGTVGQLGDLAESLFKREAGVKDSGGFFPGHGGVLDRLDSLYVGVPATALVLYAFGVL